MHDHSHNHSAAKNLRLAFFLNLGFAVLEIIGGFYVNSIAIISDAVHDLGDSLSLGTAWYLDSKSKQSADDSFTFGYARFSLLGALINSIVLIAGSAYVIYTAIGRIIQPEQSDADGMIVFAIVGVAVNGYAAWKMSGGKSLNERVVSWHLMEDVLGWAAVLVVAIVLKFENNLYLDPALSLLITLYILYGVTKRLKETLFIFLQGAPVEVDMQKLKSEVLNLENVESMHHTHTWSLEGERHVFSTHIRLRNIENLAQLVEVRYAIKDVLRQYPFSHYTVETELDEETCNLNKVDSIDASSS